MNSLGYLGAKLLKALGLSRSQYRLRHAATELRLLKESETMLGFHCWAQVRDIPELAKAYNGINSLLDQRQENLDAIAELHQPQGSDSAATRQKHMREQAQQLEARSASLKERNAIITNHAKELKQEFDALNQADPATLDHDSSMQKAKLKTTFTALREELTKNTTKLQLYADKIQQLRKDSESEATSSIRLSQGEISRRSAKISAQIGILDSKLEHLYAEVGAYLSAHSTKDPKCAEITQSEKRLTRVAQELSKSIQRNHAIAGR